VISYRSDDVVLWMDFGQGQEFVVFPKESRTGFGHIQPSLQYVHALFTSIWDTTGAKSSKTKYISGVSDRSMKLTLMYHLLSDTKI